jgi:hypothetical protein
MPPTSPPPVASSGFTGVGFRKWSLGLRIFDSAFKVVERERIQDSGFRALRLEFGIQNSGFRVVFVLCCGLGLKGTRTFMLVTMRPGT